MEYTKHFAAALLLCVVVAAADFTVPAGDRYAGIGPKGSILPGGRVIQPLGVQLETGPAPKGMAVSPNGVIATTDTGPERYGLTLYERGKGEWRGRHIWARTPNSKEPEAAEPDWKGVSEGIAFESENSIWISEGASGRVRLLDSTSGNHRRIVDLNQGEWHGSFTSELSNDAGRHLLFVIDRANSRVAVIDTKKGQVVSSFHTESPPCAVRFAPGAAAFYVATAGESNDVLRVGIGDAANPVIDWRLRLRSSPSYVAATADRVFVSSSSNDSVAMIDASTHTVVADLDLRIPHLEQFRGIRPEGLAFDPVTGWLLIAEAGINAMGVVDTHSNKLIGHIPVGWLPTRIVMAGDRVYVANARGRGTGPGLRRPLQYFGEPVYAHAGTISTFVMPALSELPQMTGTVYGANGLYPKPQDPPPVPDSIKYVVLIVRGRDAEHTFDQVLGDVHGMPELARLGMHGVADGGRVQFSIKDAAVTPNQHAIAEHWAVNDNYYVDEDAPVDTNALRQHLERHGVSVAGEIMQMHFPQLLCIQLAGRQTGTGYEATGEAESDLATGRILETLSHRPEWREMAVFITGAGSGRGVDHIDSHRIVLLAAGPWVKRGFVSHTNSSWPGLARTIFALLHVPPMNLLDASAASLSNIFTDVPDFTSYEALPPDRRVYDPEKL